MGACYSQTKIKKELKKDFKKQTRIAKLLLLGAGQSGKSTIVKQMKLIDFLTDSDQRGFTEEEKCNAKIAVYINMVDASLTLIDAVTFLNINEMEDGTMFGSQEECLRKKGDIICSYGEHVLFALSKNSREKSYHSSGSQELMETNLISLSPSEEVKNTFKEVWSNASIQAAYTRRNEFQLLDSTEYFMSEMDRICEEDYEPTDQDIIRARIQTTGVVRLQFQFKSGRFRIPFEIYDVGGQKNQRDKWIHCFDNVTCVLFVVSIAEFDQVLEEDDHQLTNRMLDSLQLFGDIVNNKYFEHTPFIIFLNKYDLFLEKIPNQGIEVTFPDYKGPSHSPEESLKFLKKKYLSRIETRSEQEITKTIYTHTTTATDTHIVEYIFRDVMKVVLDMILGGINIE